MPRVSKNRKRSENLVTSKWDACQPKKAASGVTGERMINAAMRIGDLRSLDAVSLGNDASEGDPSAMALYDHIPGKRDRMNLGCLKRHPWIGVLCAPDREYGPACIWGRVESFLTRLSQRGLIVQAAIRMLSALFVFVNGIVAHEIADREGAQPRERQPSATRQVAFSAAALATCEFPHVARFRPPTVRGLPAIRASAQPGRSPLPDLRESGRAKRKIKTPVSVGRAHASVRLEMEGP